MTAPLILVVGPSGVGKDTLLAGARAALADDPAFVFARRDITRPPDPGGEPHNPVSAAEFAAIAARGGYLLHWQAHGLSYGLPIALEQARQQGRTVVANGSRATIAEARARLTPLRLVAVTAPPALLRARLAARGRETAPEIDARVARAAAHPVSGDDVIEVVNAGTVEDGVAALIAALRRP
ncbi:MAG: phosphonate metabolism protein/1,5-bisphosphokinase (PRPP-forming) PhnN [Polymorphobacter sp.]|uniref:phosphonate metabolism protein/1,5-bisphosphokinase (PRPP-forming) PhnN n=1 Tax=Polymorphobacter sp. TaxID=1909290 RepID=UPI003A89B49D